MTTLEILRAARKRIELPEHWCQNRMAHDSQLRGCDALDEQAVAWCAYGALQPDPDDAGLDALAIAMGTKLVSRFNDSHTHAEVLAAFDRAIVSEEAKHG